jgi:hypothetical protein
VKQEGDRGGVAGLQRTLKRCEPTAGRLSGLLRALKLAQTLGVIFVGSQGHR